MLKQLYLAVVLAAVASAAPAAAELLYPVDVAFDRAGKLFVADHEAHAILAYENEGFRIVAQGPGRPRTPLYGIRHIAPDGDGVFVASDPATMKLYRVSVSGSIEPVPDDDGLVTPWGVAVAPSGDILVVDRVTMKLRRIQKSGEVEDLAQIRAPRAVLFDEEGKIVVLTDRALLRIAGGTASPITTKTPFELPHDAVLHPDGNFYVTDGYARAIWRVSPGGEVTALVQGDPLRSPQGLAVDARGILFVADAHAKAVFSVTPKGELTRLGDEARPKEP